MAPKGSTIFAPVYCGRITVSTAQTNEIASLKRAISLYGATISSHNGGLTNINIIHSAFADVLNCYLVLDPNWYTSVNPYGTTSLWVHPDRLYLLALGAG